MGPDFGRSVIFVLPFISVSNWKHGENQLFLDYMKLQSSEHIYEESSEQVW